MKVLSVVGPSGSGKTTLIERIVPKLKERGLKVLVIKHALNFDVDREGKDSWRIFESGADVVVASPKELFYRARMDDDLDRICKIFDFYDLIITEGFNRACKDRIVVLRKPEEIEMYKCGKILAVVCDSPIEGWFGWNDLNDLVELILDWLRR